MKNRETINMTAPIIRHCLMPMVSQTAPTIIVIPMSFSASQYLEFPPREWSLRWYEHYLNSPEWIQATWTSLKAGFFTMCLATPIGTAAAYGLFVTKHPLSRMFYVLLITPIMIPVILIAIAAFYVFVQIKMVNSMFGLVIAHSILALPLVLIVISAALKSFVASLARMIFIRSRRLPLAVGSPLH